MRYVKFLILNTDYTTFLEALYAQHARLQDRPFTEQLRKRHESLFGLCDFYSRNLQKLGHEAHDIYVNNEFLQKAWINEFRPEAVRSLSSSAWRQQLLVEIRQLAPRTPLKYLKKYLRSISTRIDEQAPAWFYQILTAQIKYYAPDVLLIQNMIEINPEYLNSIKQDVRVIVGQQATPIPERDYSCYDLVISSAPPIIDFFRKREIPAERVPHAFEESILQIIPEAKRSYDLTFLGNLFPGFHQERIELIEYLCQRFPQMMVWTPSIDHLASDSSIRKCYAGQAWGKEVYEILRKSKITMNNHGNTGPFANNLRLYEATGMGAMLLTDWKEDLHTFFMPEKEVATYRTPEECAIRIEYFLTHEEERRSIASAGQARTLSEHTYTQRVQQLLQILAKYF